MSPFAPDRPGNVTSWALGSTSVPFRFVGAACQPLGSPERRA